MPVLVILGQWTNLFFSENMVSFKCAPEEMIVDRWTSSLGFRAMALEFRVRDLLRPRKDIVKEAGIEKGFSVLDYGCGPGCYIAPVAELVGKLGRIFALNFNPLAVGKVKKIAERESTDER